MKLSWPLTIILIAFSLMLILKVDELKHLSSFYHAQRTFKLKRFELAKAQASPEDADLIELWESMLTGRSAPVAKWIKLQYKALGLNHLFTPSGFHLSAVMLPIMKLIPQKNWQLFFLLIVSGAIFTMVGQGALKRMALVKLNQRLLGQRVGFAMALLMDVLFGSFTDSPLSFVYSFLFLGIIYSGSGWLFLWFYFAQSLIAFFTGDLISPMVMVLSPLLNVGFALAMPLLFLLAFPLWHWQLQAGLFILRYLQKMVTFSAVASTYVPSWEVGFGVLLCFTLFYLRKRKLLALAILLLCPSLNLEQGKTPSFGNYDFVPQGKVVKIVTKDWGEVVHWSDGQCRRELLRGVWWEKCSPKRRRSTRKSKSRKLSSASREHQKSSLRGSRT